MANAVFATKVQPAYDDLPESRYHFPATYLNQAQQALQDWILYYEPRREGSDPSGRSGRKSYFATARLDRIVEDPERRGFYYGYVSAYLEFTNPVPFRSGLTYREAALRKPDGSTNKGAFGRSVRLIEADEFRAICQAGFADTEIPPLESLRLNEDPLPMERPIRTILSERTFRDAAFSKTIQRAYSNTCCMTGLRLVNGGGRCEIEAAHIKPVASSGPDSPRNGLALSRTVHWMFDRGIFSVAESGEILIARRLVPDQVRRMLNESGSVVLPDEFGLRPHPEFLKYHREKIFKGD
jgi:putative restriction endonuclease